MKPVILSTPDQIREYRSSLGAKTVGFVPTMGALHAGHGELLRQAALENDVVVLSIFVNPTQFNDPKDFNQYPITWDADLKLAEAHGVDAIFAPQAKSLYPDDYHYQVTENEMSLALCGANRPGHFTGVLSVVLKLLNLVHPTRAYFGEKDFQQLSLIQGMVDALFLPVQIRPVSTVREEDGLAMSSRNVRLTASERLLAPKLVQIIRQAPSVAIAREELAHAGFRVDYVEDKGGRRFVAAFLGSVRLIDNIPWAPPVESEVHL